MWIRFCIHRCLGSFTDLCLPKISSPTLGEWENRIFSVACLINQSHLFIHFGHRIFCWAVWKVVTDIKLISKEQRILDESDFQVLTLHPNVLSSLKATCHLTSWVEPSRRIFTGFVWKARRVSTSAVNSLGPLVACRSYGWRMTWGPLFNLLLLGFSRRWAVKPQLKIFWWTISSNSIWPTLKCPVKTYGRSQFQPGVQSVVFI